jgi:hypothetical protein
MKKRKNLSPSLIISLFFALLTWIIFYPGILSVDSLYTIQEASTGSISDARSPFITMLLALFLRLGGTVGMLTLFQTLSGFLGLRRFILAITSLFPNGKLKREWIACIVISLLSSPLTPVQVYFATFWVDTWLAILLLWIAAVLLELAVEINKINSGKNHYRIFLLIILIVFAMLARPNSPILYPALALAFLSMLRNKSFDNRALLFLALCPLMVYFLFVTFQYRVIGVKRVHPERVAFALDLASMLVYDPSICETLSLPSCRIVLEKFPPEFIVGHGAIDRTLNQGLASSEPGFVELFTSPSLKKDLSIASFRYPGIYSTVKILNFLDYIKFRRQYYYQSFIPPNDFSLYFDNRFEFARNILLLLLSKVYRHPILKYFSFVHVTWIIGNLAGILFFLTFGAKFRQYKFLALVLNIPAVYYFSYLLAMTASDFRFMYPSLLITQAIIITLVFHGLASKNLFIALSTIVGMCRDILRQRSTEAIRHV